MEDVIIDGLKPVKCDTQINKYATFRRGDLGIHAPVEDGECVIVKLAGYPHAFHGNTCFEPCTGLVHLAGFDGMGTRGLTAEAAAAMLDHNDCLLVDMASTRIATDEEALVDMARTSIADETVTLRCNSGGHHSGSTSPNPSQCLCIGYGQLRRLGIEARYGDVIGLDVWVDEAWMHVRGKMYKNVLYLNGAGDRTLRLRHGDRRTIIAKRPAADAVTVISSREIDTEEDVAAENYALLRASDIDCETDEFEIEAGDFVLVAIGNARPPFVAGGVVDEDGLVCLDGGRAGALLSMTEDEFGAITRGITDLRLCFLVKHPGERGVVKVMPVKRDAQGLWQQHLLGAPA